MQSGKILVKNLKTLITGRSSIFGSVLAANLQKNGSTIYSIDQKIPAELKNKTIENEHFVQGNVADEIFFREYLKKIGPVDALVNFAAVRKCKWFPFIIWFDYYLCFLYL